MSELKLSPHINSSAAHAAGCKGLALPASGRIHARIVDEKGRDELALTIDDARKAEHGKHAVDDRKIEPAQAGRADKRSRAF